MSDKHFHTRAKIIEDRDFEIMRNIVLNEINNEQSLVCFRQRLQRLIETTATSRILLDDEVIKRGDTHNDFYGFFRSFEEPMVNLLEDPKIKREGITAEVHVTIEQRYAFLDEPLDKWAARFVPRYRMIPRDWIIVDKTPRNTRSNVEKWASLPWEEAFEIAPSFGADFDPEEVLLWTSRDTPEQNRERFVTLIERFKSMGVYSTDEAESKIANYDSEIAKLIPQQT